VSDRRRAEVVAAALAILEESGLDAVTMRAIADRLGIRAPSLYRQFPDKRAIEIALIAAGFEDQAAAFEGATMTDQPPGRAIARVYRAWALAHPHLYRLMTERPLPRAELPIGLEARAAAPVLRAFGGDVDRARAGWAFAHGMTSLELAGRFPADADLEAGWAIGIDALSVAQPSRPRARADKRQAPPRRPARRRSPR
jgi:AcrR family transcriptional regulator